MLGIAEIPRRVALAYTEDSQWRNRDEFFTGRDAIKDFLTRKWASELDYRLMKELWAYTDNRISVALRVRVAGREQPVVPDPRQRTLGVRRGWSDAPPRYERE